MQLVQGCDLSHFSFLLRHSRQDVIILFRRRTRGVPAVAPAAAAVAVGACWDCVAVDEGETLSMRGLCSRLPESCLLPTAFPVISIGCIILNSIRASYVRSWVFLTSVALDGRQSSYI